MGGRDGSVSEEVAMPVLPALGKRMQADPWSPMASQPSLVSEPQACETLRLQSKTALEERQLRLCSGFYIHVYMCAYILSLSCTKPTTTRQNSESSMVDPLHRKEKSEPSPRWRLRGSELISGCWGTNVVYFFWVILLLEIYFH